MKRACIIIIYVLASSFTFPDNGGGGYLVHRLIVQKESKLVINGRTNVSAFHCSIPNYLGSDTLVLREGGHSKKPFFIKGSVALQTSLFDCGIPVMTYDLKKTIKAI